MNLIKILELVKNFNMDIGLESSTQKSTVFICTWNEQSENKVKNTISFTIA